MSVDRRLWLIATAIVSVTTWNGGALGAQEPSLDRVELQVEAARFGAARAELEAWLSEGSGGASRTDRQRALWLRAILTVDPMIAEMDLRRLTIEYPGGIRTGAALFRLSQIALASEREADARRYLESVVQNHPESPYRAQAVELLSALGSGGPIASATVDGDAVEIQSDDSDAQGGISTGTGGVDATDDLPSVTGPPVVERALYTVELGAFSTSGEAGRMATRAAGEGISVRVVRVPGDPRARVRAGEFVSRESADRRAAQLREAGFDVVVTPDAHLEVDLQ